LAVRLVSESAEPQRTGRYRGLLLGDAARFLMDLALNLRVRARLTEFCGALSNVQERHRAVRRFVDVFRPYQERVGFVDAFGGPLYETLSAGVAALADGRLDAALRDFVDWSNPAVRHGALQRLLGALDSYANDPE
jgi:hypothetical protein